MCGCTESCVGTQKPCSGECYGHEWLNYNRTGSTIVMVNKAPQYVTGSVKTQHNRAFFKFLFINYLSQVYPLANFQSHMLITSELQSYKIQQQKIDLATT